MVENYVQICPKCASTNLKSSYLISPADSARAGAKKLKNQIVEHPVSSILLGWRPQNPGVFICLDCDYYGICPEVDETKVKHFKKKLKRQS